ncbi:MAG: hypothetical protein QW727_03220 [Candidatus Pacearchaeota archaeon]
MADEFKRHTAYKIKIGDLFDGNKIFENDKFNCLEFGGKKISRVNIIANVVEKFSSSEKHYIALTIDDASGQVRIKIFGDDVLKFLDISQGDTILVIGLIRYYNDELYISPEIIRKQDPRYLLVRKLELEKFDDKKVGKEKLVEISDIIIKIVKNSEPDGVSHEKLIMEIDEDPNIINTEIQKALENGIIYEPRPGMLRYLQ